MAEHPVGVYDVVSGAGVADIRTRERTVGGSTQAEQVIVPIEQRVRTGTYHASSGILSYTAAADAGNGGKIWIMNRSAAQMVAVRQITFQTWYTATTVFLPTPRFTIERCTFTGTPTGTLITPGKGVRTTQNGETLHATNVGEVRSTSLGWSVTAGEVLYDFFGIIVPILIASGAPPTWPVPQFWHPAGDTYQSKEVILASGESIVVRQADAGVASDTRKFSIDIIWDEYTLP